MKQIIIISFLFISTASFSQTVNDFLVKGNEWYKKGDYKQAQTEYEKVLKKDEKNTTAQFNTGVALQRQKNYTDAAKLFQTSAENSTDTSIRARSLYNKGIAEVNQKQLQEAINSFKQSLRVNPSDDDARENLQKALNELNKQNKQQQNQNKKQDQKPQDKKQENKMNKQQAENLLNQLRQEEKRLQEMQKQKIKQVKPDKDW